MNSPTSPLSHPSSPDESAKSNRRMFLQQAGALAAVGFLAGREASAAPAQSLDQTVGDRRDASFLERKKAAEIARDRDVAVNRSNGDEDAYPTRIASYSKGLPHNDLGEVDRDAFASLLVALTSGQPAEFERIRLGRGRKLTDPQAGLAFDLEGTDSHQLFMPPAPKFDSAEEAGEMVELYWMALARDVPFNDYDDDRTIRLAAGDLSKLSDFRGPKRGGAVTSDTIFRGGYPGETGGPYLSQFLWHDVPFGANTISQKMKTTVPNVEYMTKFADWLDVQRGRDDLGGTDRYDPEPRYIRNLRDLGQWVHVDALYQAYVHACLLLLGWNAPVDPGLPPTKSKTQIGFVDFGGPHVLSLVTEVATRALKAVWYQKWFVHRRLRPEAFGGRIELVRKNLATYPVHPDALNSAALDRVFSSNGTYLLPMAFPEGSPTHPAYGAGHATVAGACVTILKAFFDESWVIPDPVVASRDGRTLVPYRGEPLTVGGELNKVAGNIAIGRNAAGVHWRSDYAESLKLGEALAISILQEQKTCHNESFTWTLTTFDGRTIVI